MEELYRMRAIRIFNVIIATVGGLGAMGLSLCSVGLYGLVAYAATRRTREIGIRMAIGANSGAVLRMVLRQGVVLVLTGLVPGLVTSMPTLDLLRAAFPTGTRQGVVAGLLVVVPIVLTVTFLAVYAPGIACPPDAGTATRVANRPWSTLPPGIVIPAQTGLLAT